MNRKQRRAKVQAEKLAAQVQIDPKLIELGNQIRKAMAQFSEVCAAFVGQRRRL